MRIEIRRRAPDSDSAPGFCLQRLLRTLQVSARPSRCFFFNYLFSPATLGLYPPRNPPLLPPPNTHTTLYHFEVKIPEWVGFQPHPGKRNPRIRVPLPGASPEAGSAFRADERAQARSSPSLCCLTRINATLPVPSGNVRESQTLASSVF